MRLGAKHIRTHPRIRERTIMAATRKPAQDRKPKAKPLPKLDPRFRIEEYDLIYETKSGAELTLTLDVPTGVVLDAMGGHSEREQIASMLEALGDEDNLALYRSLGWMSEGQLVTTTYFTEFGRLHKATTGE